MDPRRLSSPVFRSPLFILCSFACEDLEVSCTVRLLLLCCAQWGGGSQPMREPAEGEGTGRRKHRCFLKVMHQDYETDKKKLRFWRVSQVSRGSDEVHRKKEKEKCNADPPPAASGQRRRVYAGDIICVVFYASVLSCLMHSLMQKNKNHDQGKTSSSSLSVKWFPGLRQKLSSVCMNTFDVVSRNTSEVKKSPLMFWLFYIYIYINIPSQCLGVIV